MPRVVRLQGSGRRAVQLSVPAELVGEVGTSRRRHAAEEVGMPTEVLRRRLHGDVDPEIQGLLAERTGQRVVGGED
jgi:hypothetical protein